MIKNERTEMIINTLIDKWKAKR
jgi:hypothetical protein